MIQHVINVLKVFYEIIYLFYNTSLKPGLCFTITIHLNLDTKFSVEIFDVYLYFIELVIKNRYTDTMLF